MTINPIEISPYRPISILLTLSKVYKQINLQQKTKLIENYYQLKETRSSYCKGH